jgi:hypothetical protein
MSGRADQYNVTLFVDGIGDTGTWDKMSGGAGDSTETKYRPGNMGSERSLGGARTTENVTVSRLCDEVVLATLLKPLFAARGRARCVVSKQPLDPEGVAFGSPLVYNGTLKAVTPPDPDSESEDPALLEVEITVDGDPG